MTEHYPADDMTDIDNPRYVSEADFYRVERDIDMAAYHASEDERARIGYDDVANYDDIDDPEDREDEFIFSALQEIHNYSWTDETVVSGRTATIAVAKLKRPDSAHALEYAASIDHRSTRLDLILSGGMLDSLIVFISQDPSKFELLDIDTESLLDEPTRFQFRKGLSSAEEATVFVKNILPGLIFMLEREARLSRRT